MKKRLQKMLAPNSVMFYVLFFLFAVVGLYFSRVYGAAGIVAVSYTHLTLPTN